jgi:hypothetical protein
MYAKEPGAIFQLDVMELYPLWYRICDEYERQVLYQPKIMLLCISTFIADMYGPSPFDKQDYPSIGAAMVKIFVHMGKPKILQGDQKIIEAFRNQLMPYITGVTLVMSKPHETNKNAIVERAIRTLKNDLLKYLYVHKFARKTGNIDTTSQILQEI